MSKHTPTPWIILQTLLSCSPGNDVNRRTIYGGRNYDSTVLVMNQDRGKWTPDLHANAEFIVRACNAHDEIVAACTTYVAAAKAGDSTLDCFAQIEAALNKAEGK